MDYLSNRNILLIDDDPKVRRLVKFLLEKEGIKFFGMPSIDLGLQVIRSHTINLFIVDINMPNKSGYDFLKYRKKNKNLLQIPCIIFSGENDKDSVLKAIQLGANDFHSKPLDSVVLMEKIKKLMV